MWDRVALHRDFHFVPIRHAGLPLLEAELRRLWDHTDHLQGLYFFRDEKAHLDMAPDHRAIAEACASGDAERAVVLMDEHRAHALDGIARHVGARSQQGEHA
jgi:DNA-binding GntR family transcriptional regulator